MSNPNHDPSNGQFTSGPGGAGEGSADATTKVTGSSSVAESTNNSVADANNQQKKEFEKNPINPVALKEKEQQLLNKIPKEVNARTNLIKIGQAPDNLARGNADKFGDILDGINQTEAKKTLHKGFEATIRGWASANGLSSDPSGPGRSCTDFIQYLVDGIGKPYTWGAGPKMNRDTISSLEFMTVIATFTDGTDNAKYGEYENKPKNNPGRGTWQHAAVVVGVGMGKDRGGKDTYGVWVVDQYATDRGPSDGRLDHRFIAIDELMERNYRQVKVK